MSKSESLFEPVQIGSFSAKNRIFMAPMTRGRAQPDGTPNPIMATYYEQRSGAGVIISEGVSISVQGRGWFNAPGIYTDKHVDMWRPVTEAVHIAGSGIFLQLWHMGRASHPDFQEQAALPVAPSAIAADGELHTPLGKKAYVTPRALAADELPGVASDYASAARRAIDAGFDGVEIHGANGYLIDQFIRDHANQRDDDFGGSIEGRWRFPLQVVQAVAEAVGPERTGIRLSPTGKFGSMGDADPVKSYTYGAQKLDAAGIAFVHVVDPLPGHLMANDEAPSVHQHIRRAFSRTLILNGGFDDATGGEAVTAGQADAISYGMPFLANPDLPQRYRSGATQFNPPDFGTLYSPGEQGYTDYPTLG